MIKGNPRFGYILSCDICSHEEEFNSLGDASDYMLENDWINEKHKGEWQDICPECQEG